MTLRNAQTPTETDTRHDVTPLHSRRPHTITWIPPGGSFVVDRHRIDRGFIHIGTGTRSLDYRIIEPALIDPELPVDWNRPNPDTGISGCPGYAELSPRARAGYLNWLADGRRNPDIDDGLLLLFIAGLERRLLEVGIDTRSLEIDQILAELQRLAETYSSTHRISAGYARSLWNRMTTVRHLHTAQQPPPWEPGHCHVLLPIEVSIGIGKFVAAHEPIPAEWALALVQHHPQSRLRTPALRCPEEFAGLFKQLYAETFGDGIVISHRLPHLTVSHEPASLGVSSTRLFRTLPIPDIAHANGPIIELGWLSRRCTDLLDQYSRHLGRHPNDNNSIEAISLLPAQLLTTHGDNGFHNLRHWLDQALSNGACRTASYSDLIDPWPNARNMFNRKTAIAVANLLEKANFDIEPDPRLDRRSPALTTTVTVERLRDLQ